ncbi:MAG: DUF4245 domain-containing protein [Actinomycetia bacterium]|nr:DUF4245 domain-containing protein [Actinomycetes bacterium]
MTQAPSAPTHDRRNPALGDMLRSVLVLGAIVALFVGATALMRDDPPEAGADIEYAEIASEASSAVPYPLLAPTSLPDGWRANSARVVPGEPPSWHLGMLTAGDDYVGIEQAKASVRAMVAKHAEGTRPAGSADLGGQTWKVRAGGDGETTFVRHQGGVTTLVTGDAPREQIERYIESLEPAS